MRDLPFRLGLLCACIAVATALPGPSAHAQGLSSGQDFALIQRGRYLVTLADCAACHDDPAGGRPFAGGRPIQTPFGTLHAANITPDETTGIGGWSDTQFDAALRRGRMPNGQRLYPAMPYVYYSRMSQDDTRAMHAYLNTVMPIRHAVTADTLPFPFKLRLTMRVWDALFFRPAPLPPRPKHSAAWNRGAWIVAGPGHCEACHTPKGWLGEDLRAHAFRGYRTQGWFAPDISTDPQRGLGRWSQKDIAQFLRSGHNALAAASGPMGEEITDSSSKFTESDLAAVAEFLADPAAPGRQATHATGTALAATDSRMRAGAAIYRDLCSACHQLDGRGVAFLFPDLTADNAVAAIDPTSLIRVVLIGTRTVASTAEPTAPAMPGYRWQLSDAQAAAVLTYVRDSWGHAAGAVSPRQVREARRRLQDPTAP